MTSIDQPYFEWLISQIEIPKIIRKTFYELFFRLHETEFIWIVDGDDNRVQDAKDLRLEFANKSADYFHELEFKPYISILEVMIALSRKLEFIAGGQAPGWVWRLIDNLELDHFSDPLTRNKISRLDDILERLIWRTYKRDGYGGFFPLISPKEDQTKVELWYQMNAYVNEIVQE